MMPSIRAVEHFIGRVKHTHQVDRMLKITCNRGLADCTAISKEALDLLVVKASPEALVAFKARLVAKNHQAVADRLQQFIDGDEARV